MLDFILSTLSLILFIAFAILGNSLFAPKTRALYLVFGYLWIHFKATLIGQFLSLVELLNNPTAYVICQIVLLLGMMLIWWLRQKPTLMSVDWQWQELKEWRTHWVNLRRQYPFYATLLMVTVFVSLLSLLYIFFLPRISDDFIKTYLPRMALWYETGMIRPLSLPDYYSPLSSYPIGAQLPMYWFVLFGYNFHWASLVAWFSIPVIAAIIYWLANLLGASRIASLTVATLWMTSPGVLDLSTSGLPELPSLAYHLCAFGLLLLGLQQRHKGMLFMSALSFGLFVGAKEIALMMLPGALLAGIILLSHFRQVWHLIFGWVITAILAVLLVGSYSYVSNYFQHGTFLGERTITSVGNEENEVGKLQVDRLLEPIALVEHMSTTIPKFFVGAFDYLDQRYSTTRDGAVITLLAILGIIYQTYVGIQKRHWLGLALVIYILTFFFLLWGVRDFSLANLRYATPMMALGLVLVAPIFNLTQAQIQQARQILRQHKYQVPIAFGVIFPVIIIQSITLVLVWAVYLVYKPPLILVLLMHFSLPILAMIGIYRQRIARFLAQNQTYGLFISFCAILCSYMIVLFSLHTYGFIHPNFTNHLAGSLLLIMLYFFVIPIYFTDQHFGKPRFANAAPDALVHAPLSYLWMGLSISFIIYHILFASSTSLFGVNSIISRSYDDIYIGQWGERYLGQSNSSFMQLAPTYHAFQAESPEDTSVGLILPNKFPIAFLHGDYVDTDIKMVYPYPDIFDLAYMETNGYDALIMDAIVLEWTSQQKINTGVPETLCWPRGLEDCYAYEIDTTGLQITPLDGVKRFWLIRPASQD
jgi:hypothetical protein